MINQAIFFMWMGVFLIWAISGSHSRHAEQVRSDGLANFANAIVGAGWWLLLAHGFALPVLSRRWRPPSTALDVAGVVITAVALAFCLWARFYLGRNWSAVVAVMKNHQLIRSGPYAIVRHPIYAGFMLATLGTAIAFGELSGLVAVAMVVIAWGYKARLEEATMLEQFGPDYERYRREVKGLLPLIY
jgi:protein-S-isoprenylcysteine O-methyltransferase Ste14